METKSLFCCPICGRPLNTGEKALVCGHGHSFDLAKEGYVHLLPPNKMHSKIPGDNKQMVSARRSFLESGSYEIFSEKLNGLVLEYLKEKSSPVLLDSGCGEGYYTGRLMRFLEEKGVPVQVAGFDISKFAVKAAAKKYKNAEFAVGSVFSIPMEDKKADVLISIFAPLVPEEFFRVLKPGGLLILAVPSPRHLYGLKEVLYSSVYENEYRETEYEGFAFLERVPVRGTLRLEGQDMISNLFAMTPYYWKTPPEGCARLGKLEFLETEIGFDFLEYIRKG